MERLRARASVFGLAAYLRRSNWPKAQSDIRPLHRAMFDVGLRYANPTCAGCRSSTLRRRVAGQSTSPVAVTTTP